MPEDGIVKKTGLKLQKFDRSDFPRLISWIPDARFLLQWTGPGYSFPLDDKQLADNQWEADSHPPRKYIFKAVAAPDDEIVGHIELVRHRDDPEKGRLARVLIGPTAQRGRGNGSEMVRQVVTFGFKKLELKAIDLAVFDFNQSAIACYENIGFRRVETMQDACQFEDETWSGYRMEMSREEWSPTRDENSDPSAP